MTAQPLFSVVTPSYNQVDFIEDTLRSVREQSYRNLEHVVIDGGSDDGTIEILESYADEEYFTYVSEPDDGQADALNKGFDEINGEVVGWLNSDDVLFDTGTAERVVEYFDQFESDVIYGDMALIDAESDVLKIRCVPEFDYDRLLRSCFIEQPALFFRADVLEEERLDTSLDIVMDYEFWLRLGNRYEFKHVSDVLAGDRNHKDRKILNTRTKMEEESEEVRNRYRTSDGVPGQFTRIRDAVFSGVPRRLQAARRTLNLHSDEPDLAFDGALRPRAEMLGNVFRQNRNLV